MFSCVLTFEIISLCHRIFFVHFHDGRTSHVDEMMLCDQTQNRLHKISKISGLSHQDHDSLKFEFSIFLFGLRIQLQ
jgi:hypothetical protein